MEELELRFKKKNSIVVRNKLLMILRK